MIAMASHRWKVELREYRGPDFSRRCFLFTGQGPAAPGMFREAYERLDTFQRRFRQTDDLACAEDLPPISSFITHPETLTRRDLSVIRNLALATVQVALFDHLFEAGITPRLMTGFSLGEFPALACAGVLSFEDMFAMILARDRACPPDNKLGYLIAAAAAPGRIADILRGIDYYISNINSPSQTAIAVSSSMAKRALAAFSAADIRAKLLETVPQPYHSPLMESSARRFQAWLKQHRPQFPAPAIPVISSITRSLITDGQTIANVLGRQLTEPVDFVEQIKLCYGERAYTFLEIGPGSTLSTFTRDILAAREHRVMELAPFLPQKSSTLASSVPEQSRSPLFTKLRRAIAKITGYEIESISIEDRFQEDLGIDSIKKANILFTVLDDEKAELPAGGYDASLIRSIGEAVTVLSAQQSTSILESAEPPGEKVFARYIASWRRCDLSSGFAQKMSPQVVALTSDAIRYEEWGRPTVMLVGGEEPESLTDILFSLRTLALAAREREVDFCIVTQQTIPVAVSGLIAFLKSLRKECARLFFRHIHFDEKLLEKQAVQMAVREMEAGEDVEVLYRGGDRYVSTSKPLPAAPVVNHLPEDAVILGFGCAQGIGRVLLERMPWMGSPWIYLAGRSPQEKVAEALESLAQRATLVKYQQLDACNACGVQKLFDAICRSHGRIDVVLNAAGIQRSALMATKSLDDVEEEFSTKVSAASNILAASRSLPVGLVVNFSSIVARWGNPGQTVYGCANAVMGRMTEEHNRMLSRRAAISVEWPAWDGVGMTAEPLILSRLRACGFSLLDPLQAIELFTPDLQNPPDEVVQYIEPRDIPMLEAGLRDHRRYRSVIGYPTPEGAFERVFDVHRDQWLADHSIEGTPYVPAATFLTMALCLGSFVLRRDCALVSDFRLTRPVELRGRTATLRLSVRGQEDGLTIQGSSGAPCFRCIVRSAPNDSVQHDCDLESEHATWQPCTAYAEGALFHGPAFQMLHQTAEDESGRMLARVVRERLPRVYGAGLWDHMTLLLDSAFQLLALDSIRCFGVETLPVAVEHMTVFMKEEDAILRVSGVSLTGDTVSGNVIAVSESGELLFHLEGVRMAVIRPVRRQAVA